MNWQDKGYLLSINKFNENSSIAEFYSKEHGKVSGIIFGSSSKKIKNYLFIGNRFHLNYFSKNINNIGNFKIEIDRINTPIYLDDRVKLNCIIYTMNLVKMLTVESQVNHKIYNLVINYFELLKKDNWIKDFILWELDLFKYLGFGIDFNEYVIKKMVNGKIVHVLKNDNKKELPNFLIDRSAKILKKSDFINALNITGNFLEKTILNINNKPITNSRNEFLNQISIL